MIQTTTQCVYFDRINQQFAILEDELGELHFVHWRELVGFELKKLEEYGVYRCHLHQTHIGERGSTLGYIAAEPDARFNSQYSLIDGRMLSVPISQQQLLEYLGDRHTQYIFMYCDFDDIEIDDTPLHVSQLVFIHCSFSGNCRLIGSQVERHIWMPNCEFKQHFSLKNSELGGDVHLEGCNFSGAGGASFRGLKAQNLYLDFGVKGSRDLFWLNEMQIKNEVSIAGHFGSSIQLLGIQEVAAVPKPASIGRLSIGVGLYAQDEINNTSIANRLQIADYQFSHDIEAAQLVVSAMSIERTKVPKLQCDAISVATDLVIDSCVGSMFAVRKSSIGRHFRFVDNHGELTLDLTETSVAQNCFIESKLQHAMLHRLVASRVLFYPANLLLGDKPAPWYQTGLKPQAFKVLENSTPQDQTSKQELMCSLKQWYADSGALELEDIAYFHMRDAAEPSGLKRAIFGGVFGWGVRLKNIVFSSLLLIICFAVWFSCLTDVKHSLHQSLILSAQSFISSFFGKWQDIEPHGVLGMLVTLESMLGIIFITVLVGAYIRKLLR
ncbi:hypothetical protein ACSLBF_00295 [Pseudoalteromonas sp. T1lg65]|uniref:hypothetical protein n=1 Tax=Pseudoalteromonas sp. T1lg65 TaxID=2077101 RepID=UPI003F792A99